MIAEAGSRAGTGGTSTSPAPSIPRLDDPLEPVPREPPRDAVRPDPMPRLPELPDVGPDRPLCADGTDGREGADGRDGADGCEGTDGCGGVGCLVVAGAGGVRPACANCPDRVVGDGRMDLGGCVTRVGGATSGYTTPVGLAGSAGSAGSTGCADSAGAAVGRDRGAMPQTSQKPSVSTWPVQPGWAHRFIAGSPSRSHTP
ncbi:hypothetical protein GCM10022254_56000 [Actinomadura meridiana]|uniref:Uncharacterized protein n=1 Tax=Actinomadura meridiana TaxID=559626 RepID=A0ABP8CG17_9ACTN